MRRIDEVWMCRAEVSGELVQSVVSNKDTGRDVQHAVFSIEVLNGGAAAGRITFAKDFLEVAAQKLNNSIIHSSILCPRAWGPVSSGATSPSYEPTSTMGGG